MAKDVSLSEATIVDSAGTAVVVTGGGGGGAPSGSAGGVLAGTYPDPTFAVDMATQAEVDDLDATGISFDPTGLVVVTGLTVAAAIAEMDAQIAAGGGTGLVAGGDLADRPAAGAGLADTLFFVQDLNGGTLEWCNGSSWVQAALGVSEDLAGAIQQTGGRTQQMVGANSGSAYTMDLSLANAFVLSLTANTTLSIANPPADGLFASFDVILIQDSTGSRTVQWPGSVISPPTMTATASRADHVRLTTYNGGTQWLIETVRQDMTGLVASGGWSANTVAGQSSGTDAASYATTTWTPTANRFVFGYVTNSKTGVPDTPTLAGNGLTWTQVDTETTATNSRQTLFVAKTGGTVTAGAVTASFGGVTQTGCTIEIVQVNGADVTGTALAAVLASAKAGSSTNATSGTVSLAGAPAGTSRCFSFWTHQADEVTAPRANWVELVDVTRTAPSRAIEAQWRPDASEQTASASWATSAQWGGMIVEVKAAP